MLIEDVRTNIKCNVLYWIILLMSLIKAYKPPTVLQLSSNCPPGFFIIIQWFPPCRSCYPPWFLMLILFSPRSMLVSHCLPCFLLRFLMFPSLILSDFLPGRSWWFRFSSLSFMFPPCWSWWWSRLNLSDDVLLCFCFMPVSFLWGDYRGWLLIIFILNILLWWYLFLSF